MSVGVVGSMKVRPEKVSEFERLFTALTATVRQEEPGTLAYQLVRVRGQPHTYKSIELYRDQAAFEHHARTAYLQQALPQLNACLDGTPLVERVESVD